MYYNPTPQLTSEMSQINSSTAYTLGDSPLGTTWFIQASDLHLARTDGVANSFQFDSFYNCVHSSQYIINNQMVHSRNH